MISGWRQWHRARASGCPHGPGRLVRPCARGLSGHGSPGSPPLHRGRRRCHHHQQLLRHSGSNAALWNGRTLRGPGTGARCVLPSRSATGLRGRISVVVAGSVSSYGRFGGLDRETMSGHFRAQEEILVDEGVDLLILETLGSTVRTIKAMVNATRDLGVPVWVSISCVRDRDTGAVMLGIEESSEASHVAETYVPLADAVREIMSAGGSAVLMMHSVRDLTEDAVRVMRANYSGPVGAYPNAGYWTRPNWAFVDQVSPGQYLADAKRWVEAGAVIVGGCCGVGVEHIRALAEGLQGL